MVTNRYSLLTTQYSLLPTVERSEMVCFLIAFLALALPLPHVLISIFHVLALLYM